MKWYPWLSKSYKKIIQSHQINKAHHALLIKTQHGMGVNTLIWFVSRWLLCTKSTGINFCNTCHSCKLMLCSNHPDWHSFSSEKNKIVNVDDIREINSKIFKCPQQGKAKIIFLSDIERLTESASDAFLKTLEEPPKNTWFFLVSYDHFNLYSTLNSRCIIHILFPPKEKNSLNWLKKEVSENYISCLTALRINQGSPISSKNFINSEIWKSRIKFFKILHKSLKNKDLLNILPLLHTTDSIIKINWICFLLLDSIKIKFQEYTSLINLDQIELVQFLSRHYTNTTLDHSIRTWMKCRYRLLKISGINYELLLLEQLMVWEKILNFSFIS